MKTIPLLMGNVTLAIFAATLAGCSPSPETAAESTLRQKIESESTSGIILLGFKKTDGQKMEFAGIQGYKLDYEAEIQFKTAGVWVSHSKLISERLDFVFAPGQRVNTTAFGALSRSMNGAMNVNAGDKVKFVGSMAGEKKESGWHFEASESRTTSAPVAGTLSPPTTKSEYVAAQEREHCIDNLLFINTGKVIWASKTKQFNGTPTWADLLPFVIRGTNTQPLTQPLVCPSGGIYTIGSLDEKPQCSIPGHSL